MGFNGDDEFVVFSSCLQGKKRLHMALPEILMLRFLTEKKTVLSEKLIKILYIFSDVFSGPSTIS